MLLTPFLLPPRNSARGTQRYARMVFSTPITVRHLTAGGVRSSRGISLDISEGGIGALVEATLGVGDTVEIELALSGCDLIVVGIVRHWSITRSGFEFLGLTPDERERIASLVGNA